MNGLPINLKPLTEGFRLYNIVVKSCFGQEVQPDFQTHTLKTLKIITVHLLKILEILFHLKFMLF